MAFPLFGEPHASAPGASGAEPNRLESLSEISYIGSVLYVEDNKANALLMEEVFEQFPNLRLITANNAEYGLELAAAEQTDLIMLDIDLPGMSGLEMLKILRSWEGFTGSIIAVSAHAMPHHVKEGLAAGFDAYLTKPFDFARLTAELERVFGQLDP